MLIDFRRNMRLLSYFRLWKINNHISWKHCYICFESSFVSNKRRLGINSYRKEFLSVYGKKKVDRWSKFPTLPFKWFLRNILRKIFKHFKNTILLTTFSAEKYIHVDYITNHNTTAACLVFRALARTNVLFTRKMHVKHLRILHLILLMGTFGNKSWKCVNNLTEKFWGIRRKWLKNVQPCLTKPYQS